jgi:hypothetical protein
MCYKSYSKKSCNFGQDLATEFMKKIFLIFGLLIWHAGVVSAQEADFLVTDIKPLLENQDASGLKKYITAAISLDLPDQKGVYSQQQAEKLLSRFFSKLKSPVFELLESGITTDTNASYLIGNLKDTTAEYRIYILAQVHKKQIQSIHISLIP